MPKKIDSFSLTPKWPADIPDHCERCRNGYDIRFALEIGPSRFGRSLRRIAPWMTIIMLFLMFLTKLSFLRMGGDAGIMAFAMALILPSVALWITGGILPTKARLYCSKCNRSAYYKPPSFIDNRIAKVSE